MCGIVGMIGQRFDITELLDNLQKLEYRGYDSSGIAFINKGKLIIEKSKGPIGKLRKKVKSEMINIGIAHTRWATHGVPNDINAHPHTDCNRKLALVHNGIIENFVELKEMLERKGHKFKSETDSEVIAHLIEDKFNGNLYQAILESVKHLKGAYALAVIHLENPNQIIGVRKGSPLVFGKGKEISILASDVTPIIKYTKEVIFLEDEEIITITKDNYKLTDFNGNEVARESYHIYWDENAAEKQGFKHFMIKEINEEPKAIENALAGRIKDNEVVLKELDEIDLNKIEKIKVIACGTSYHAGLVFKYFIEKHTDLDVEVDVASEFRYRNIKADEKTLLIAISQSGETADTLESVRVLKKKNAKVIAITNVVGSTITRESDITIYMNAGPEIGVAATKTYVNQLVVLYLLGLELSKKKGFWNEELEKDLEFLINSSRIIKNLINTLNLESLAKKYKKYEHFMYIGRGMNYPTALEAALKLKEISYINATAYPAGELKHGPIALLNKDFPVFAIAPRESLYEKMKSNIEECKSRDAKVVAISDQGNEEISKICDDVIYVPQSPEDMYPLIISPAIQLFAYLVSDLRGYNPDKPKNLAKSVTVE